MFRRRSSDIFFFSEVLMFSCFWQTKLMATEHDLLLMTQQAEKMTAERDSLLVTRDDLSRKLASLDKVLPLWERG
jgi:hypothetical protein